jgi:hypothetical protein
MQVGLFRLKSLMGSLDDQLKAPETSILERLQVGGCEYRGLLLWGRCAGRQRTAAAAPAAWLVRVEWRSLLAPAWQLVRLAAGPMLQPVGVPFSSCRLHC